MKKSINITVFILVIIGLYFFISASNFPRMSEDVPGPGFFPKLLSGLLLIFCAILFYNNFKEEPNKKDEHSQKNLKSYISMGITLIYILALDYFGFIICTIPFIATLIYLFNYKKLLHIAIISIAITCIIYYLFSVLLGVPLPTGTLIDFGG